MNRGKLLVVALSQFGLTAACATGEQTNTAPDAGYHAGGASSTATNAGGLDIEAGVGGSGASDSNCEALADEDWDQDGFTINDGDCNDCDKNVNPKAIEVMTPTALPDAGADGGTPPAVDEDCDGVIDNIPQPCDDGLSVDDPAALNGARAMELCKISSGPNDWGIVEAKWVLPDGSEPPPTQSDPDCNDPPASLADTFHLGHGILDGFGPNVNVQAGSRMLALSSGAARRPTDPDYVTPMAFNKCYVTAQPHPAYPVESPDCPWTGEPHDGTGLELTLRVPSNANGFSFDFDFYTFEWPDYTCSEYNDFFIAFLLPIPAGQVEPNISFDSQGNPVTVNSAFVQVCGCQDGPPCKAGDKWFDCLLGGSELEGTGFGADTAFFDHAATSWLNTTAPFETEQITIRLAVYDSTDGALDSTTLIDNWRWIAEPGKEVVVHTAPVPVPK